MYLLHLYGYIHKKKKKKKNIYMGIKVKRNIYFLSHCNPNKGKRNTLFSFLFSFSPYFQTYTRQLVSFLFFLIFLLLFISFYLANQTKEKEIYYSLFFSPSLPIYKHMQENWFLSFFSVFFWLRGIYILN